MGDTGNPFFSIITSTFNTMETLERCVASVAEQKFRDYEHIVVDGASTDGTAEFLRSRKELFSVLLSEPDTGIYNAWNKALKQARGEWILFLGADDVLADAEVLADAASFIDENKADSGIVYGDVMMVSRESHQDRELKRVLPESVCTRAPGDVRPVLPCQSGVFHHKDLLEKYGPFDESYRVCADAKLLLQALCLSKEDVRRIPGTVCRMTVGGVCSAIGVRAAQEDIRLMSELDMRYLCILGPISLIKAYAKAFSRMMLGEKTTYRIIDLVRFLRGKPALWKQ
jgi:glycosyltransferase involved in cell wall biosynthesis